MQPKKRQSNGDGDAPAPKMNKTSSDFSSMDLSSESVTKDGKKWNFKIVTWNVDGLRAWLKKDGAKFFEHEEPDVVGLQEIKCAEEKLPEEITGLKMFPYKYWMPAEKEGYAGVGLMSKTEPLKVMYGFEGYGAENKTEHDGEGRLITAEFEDFYLSTVYVPNAGKKLVTLPKRLEWDEILRGFLARLDETKPVIICGDFNVAHKEHDLANPKTNKKNAGFTKEERDGFSKLLEEVKLVDTFRHYYPDLEKKYTFWTYMMGARAKNVGWRLDYFLASQRIVDTMVCDNQIRDQVFGSDHCPSTLFLSI